MKYIAYNFFATACVAGAIALLILDIEHGWGWLLVIATLSAVVPSSEDEK